MKKRVKKNSSKGCFGGSMSSSKTINKVRTDPITRVQEKFVKIAGRRSKGSPGSQLARKFSRGSALI